GQNILVFDLQPGANPVGGFNGGGTGNKAIAGLSGYHQLKLSDLQKVSFEVKVVSGSQVPYLNVILDLNCDGSVYKILVVSKNEFEPAADAGNGYSLYSITPSESKWRAVGGIDVSPHAPNIPTHVSSGVQAESLAGVKLKYPNA